MTDALAGDRAAAGRGPNGRARNVRKATQRRLRASEERYRTIYEQAAVGIMEIAARDGRILNVNRKLCDLLGVARESLLRQTCLDITHPDDLERERPLLARLAAGEIPSYAIEKRYRRAGGAGIWGRVTTALAGSGSGQPYRISIVEDIDEHRRAEEALQVSEERMRLPPGGAPKGRWCL